MSRGRLPCETCPCDLSCRAHRNLWVQCKTFLRWVRYRPPEPPPEPHEPTEAEIKYRQHLDWMYRHAAPWMFKTPSDAPDLTERTKP